MLRSEEVRKLAPEMDPLRMGMGWKVSDLSKPQVMVESSYGDSHPGSAHLNIFVEEAVKAVDENGGKAARYFATDMCDCRGVFLSSLCISSSFSVFFAIFLSISTHKSRISIICGFYQ